MASCTQRANSVMAAVTGVLKSHSVLPPLFQLVVSAYHPMRL